MAKAREKFWIFGVRPGQDNALIAKCRRLYGAGNLKPRHGSRITPAEAALYLDVPNMIMVNCEGQPVPFTSEAEHYAFTFTTLQKVLWSATGSGGFRFGNEEEYIVDLASRYPNICGAFMDDFFGKFQGLPEPERSIKAEALLKKIRSGLARANRPLELYTVLYTRQIDQVAKQLFQYIDGITLWTSSNELPLLEQRFAAVEKKFPDKKLLLGLYLFDLRHGYPMQRELMEHQCELGLSLLRQGRAEGLIFECNAHLGLGFDTDRWLRDWIQQVKDTEVPD